MHPRVYIIGFNSQERLDKCLESIPPKYERVVLDNGETDLTAPHGVEYHKTGPDWFTPAFNYALLDSVKHNAIPIICNDDIVLEHDCIEKLLEELPHCGIVSPMHVDKTGRTVIMGGTAEAYPAGMHLTGTREMFTEPKDYPWLPFTMVAVNPELIRTIGILDTNTQLIFSASDDCIRAARAGYAVRLLPSAVIVHEHSASIKEEREKGTALDKRMLSDRIYFEDKWGGNQLKVLS